MARDRLSNDAEIASVEMDNRSADHVVPDLSSEATRRSSSLVEDIGDLSALIHHGESPQHKSSCVNRSAEQLQLCGALDSLATPQHC